MNVLIISSNTLLFAPSGPAYIAGASHHAGHTVEIFDCLFAQDLVRELEEHITYFNPDVIGISIRLVHGYLLDESAEFQTRDTYLRIGIKELVNCIKRISQARIVLGGCGFN